MVKFVERRKMNTLGRVGLPEAVRTMAGIKDDTEIDIFYDAEENKIVLVPVQSVVSNEPVYAHS